MKRRTLEIMKADGGIEKMQRREDVSQDERTLYTITVFWPRFLTIGYVKRRVESCVYGMLLDVVSTFERSLVLGEMRACGTKQGSPSLCESNLTQFDVRPFASPHNP